MNEFSKSALGTSFVSDTLFSTGIGVVSSPDLVPTLLELTWWHPGGGERQYTSSHINYYIILLTNRCCEDTMWCYDLCQASHDFLDRSIRRRLVRRDSLSEDLYKGQHCRDLQEKHGRRWKGLCKAFNVEKNWMSSRTGWVQELERRLVYKSPKTTITNNHMLSGLKTTEVYFLIVLEIRSPKLIGRKNPSEMDWIVLP